MVPETPSHRPRPVPSSWSDGTVPPAHRPDYLLTTVTLSLRLPLVPRPRGKDSGRGRRVSPKSCLTFGTFSDPDPKDLGWGGSTLPWIVVGNVGDGTTSVAGVRDGGVLCVLCVSTRDSRRLDKESYRESQG